MNHGDLTMKNGDLTMKKCDLMVLDGNEVIKTCWFHGVQRGKVC